MSDTKHTLIVKQLAEALIRENKTLTVAESCTGGWIAKCLTDLAGSSAWFERGFVTYSNLAKQEMLGVLKQTLDSYGAVSKETVIEMASGALKNSHADVSLAVSGIAGPEGGTAEKPVGLVWFAWASQSTEVQCAQKLFKGDRNSVREQAALFALKGVLNLN